MSGVYIKGMEMPKEFDPDVYIELACGIDDKRYARLYNFHQGGLTEWCEVVPIPPHGRLIDTDAVSLEGGPYEYDEWCKWALEQYQDAPTIIPAEEGKTMNELEIEHAIYRILQKPDYAISRICSICGRYEYPESDNRTTITWICPECLKRIKQFIYPADKEEQV